MHGKWIEGRWMVVGVWFWLQRLSSLSRDSGRSIRIEFFPFSDSFVHSSRRRCLNINNALYSLTLFSFGDAGCVDLYYPCNTYSMKSRDCLDLLYEKQGLPSFGITYV
jgi:hypothetical protein